MTRLPTRRTDAVDGRTVVRVMVASAFLALTLLPLQGQQAFSLPYHFQFQYDLAPLLARHGCAAFADGTARPLSRVMRVPATQILEALEREDVSFAIFEH